MTKDKPHLAVIPIGLAALWVGLSRMHWLFWAVVFFVPFSFPLKELFTGLSFNMFLPTEPLLAALMVLFLIKLALDKRFDRRILAHPVTQIILLQLVWILITSVTSSMPGVSFKYLISRVWFLSVFFFIAAKLFQNPQNIRRYLWVFLVPLAFMVIVITIKHAGLGLFDQKASNPAVDPFFNDHTLYGAIMAMMVPVAFGYLVRSSLSIWLRGGILLVLILLLTGLLFSYSRAAWVSLVGGIGVFILVWFKVKGRTVLLGFVMLIIAFLLFGKGLLMKMERNDQDSSDNLTEHVQSISNISTLCNVFNIISLISINCPSLICIFSIIFSFYTFFSSFQLIFNSIIKFLSIIHFKLT